MGESTPAEKTPQRERDNISTWVLKHTFAYWLRTGDPAATPDQCFDSKHLNDLRFLVFVALVAVVAALVGGGVLSYESSNNDVNKIKIEASTPASGDASKDTSKSDSQRAKTGEDLREARRHRPYAVVAAFLTFFGPVAFVFGAIAAWAYQVAGTRLGVVDLFACEISTLCRVSTVLDTVPTLIKRLEHPDDDEAPRKSDAGSSTPPQPEGQFKSEENYFPVFESCTKDLQALEARVVINITAFYTYMKGVRDTMRGFAAIGAKDKERRKEATRNVIYLLYLGFESARKAIEDLVEFEPERAERTVVVLISEFVAYGFLRAEFSVHGDMRYERLKLRASDYDSLMAQLCTRIERGSRSEKPELWEPAHLLLPELRKRYKEAQAAADKPHHHNTSP